RRDARHSRPRTSCIALQSRPASRAIRSPSLQRRVTNTADTNRLVRVSGGQGFWGDWLDAPRRQVEGGPVDYLMLDYLAEVTMSILQKQKERDPQMGYARDFLGAMESVMPAVVDRGVKVIANAGGVNPVACAHAVLDVAKARGAEGKLRVGV